MPTINPNLIPTKPPGTLFNALSGGDTTLSIRWMTPVDPAFYECINRPMADITVRQLIIAKAVDGIQVQLGHQTTYPFLIQPRISSGTTSIDMPLRWIWDIHASLPKKWNKLRLAKIKRISGENSSTSGYTGTLRFIFTANQLTSTNEVSIFYADYNIGSNLTYQRCILNVITETQGESIRINQGEQATVCGFITFMTLDTQLDNTKNLLEFLEPPLDTTDSDSNSQYDNPAVYDIADSIAGDDDITGDYSAVVISHGTGLLTDSAWNCIPELDSNAMTWINTFNYPFATEATLTSVDNITIPVGLFQEFNIVAPASDQPTGDTSGTYYPVWISRIEKIGITQLRFYFATYNVTDTVTGGAPSTEAIEFATLDLYDNNVAGTVIEITPLNNLQLKYGTDSAQWEQGFGRGHVVLSEVWGNTSSIIHDFFDQFNSIVTTPADTIFGQLSTRISSYAISRVPKYIPTVGQSNALLGSTSRLATPIYPSYDNRYVTEQDQGLGRQIDLEAQSGISPNTNIDRYGYSGSLAHKMIKLVVNSDNLGSAPNFYETSILPRLRILLGRDPQFGDMWFNGTRFAIFNGDTWQG